MIMTITKVIKNVHYMGRPNTLYSVYILISLALFVDLSQETDDVENPAAEVKDSIPTLTCSYFKSICLNWHNHHALQYVKSLFFFLISIQFSLILGSGWRQYFGLVNRPPAPRWCVDVCSPCMCSLHGAFQLQVCFQDLFTISVGSDEHKHINVLLF